MGNIIREVTAEAAWVPLSFLAMFRNVSPHNFLYGFSFVYNLCTLLYSLFNQYVFLFAYLSKLIIIIIILWRKKERYCHGLQFKRNFLALVQLLTQLHINV